MTSYLDLLGGAATVVVVAAIVTLWRHELRAAVRALGVQGLALGVVASVLGVHGHDDVLIGVGLLVVVEKGVVIPTVLARVLARDPHNRESAPLVNTPTALLGAGVLTLLAFLVAGAAVAVAPVPSGRLLPFGLATVLVGFWAMVVRRRAISQIVGLLLVDNGIALVAFLATAGVPLLVELGASLDVLLVVVVARVLAAQLWRSFDVVDLDQLRELHD